MCSSSKCKLHSLINVLFTKTSEILRAHITDATSQSSNVPLKPLQTARGLSLIVSPSRQVYSAVTVPLGYFVMETTSVPTIKGGTLHFETRKIIIIIIIIKIIIIISNDNKQW